MIKAEFSYNSNITIILCSENDTMEEICKKFTSKVNIDINNLIFLYSGNQINFGQQIYQIMNKYDKERKIISVLVDQINKKKNNNDNQNLVKSPLPKCPECSENVKFEINNYIINLACNEQRHINNMKIKEYEKTQFIDLNSIKCCNCKVNKTETYKNMMNICNICKIILCPLCSLKHDKSHNLINYDNKNYTCEKHNELYNSYCYDCKSNICLKCQKEHSKHELISFGIIFPEKNILLNELNSFKNNIDIFSEDIDDIINKLNDVRENFYEIYKIYYDMITKFEDTNRNFEVIMSLNDFIDNKVIIDLKEINQINNINIKITNIMKIYEQMNTKNLKTKTNNNKINLDTPNGDEKEIYSFECLNKDKLKLEMKEGMENTNLNIVIKNNGTTQWPINGTRLIFNPEKNMIEENIELDPQKPGEVKTYKNIIKEIHSLPAGNYNAGLIFEINGKKYGEEIELKIVINEHEENEEINDEGQMIKEFRDKYNLDIETFPDEKLLDALIKCNLNYEETFSSLFGD